ncbi:hypothetical protein B0H14DRAFT_3514616 [Mycena olivaceomarginata]|nr:hypothetical protein B0H14DRAFT_3514616 [Mycena olivaceomarginata]
MNHHLGSEPILCCELFSPVVWPKISDYNRSVAVGHIGLNAYLYRFNLALSPSCSLCDAPETVAHFLLLCPKYRRERLKLIVKLGTARLSFKLLLGTKAEHGPVFSFVRSDASTAAAVSLAHERNVLAKQAMRTLCLDGSLLNEVAKVLHGTGSAS